MFTSHPVSLQLVSILLQDGIRHVVVCPGSRNAPLVHDMAEAGMNLHEVTDERSAGFFALGLIQALSEPVAVCVTSGSALLNVAPAVAEGYYQQLPLLVISADRPAAWIGQMDGQTLPQPGAFGSMSVCSVTLPEGKDSEAGWHRNRLINEALLRLHRLHRPVHINVPLSEPLFVFETSELPHERHIEVTCPVRQPLTNDTTLCSEWSQAVRKLVVVGQLDPAASAGLFTPEVTSLLAKAGVVLLYEQLSNVQCQLGAGSDSCLTTHDAILAIATPEQLEMMRPDLVITLGGHLVSKRLKQFLRSNPPQRHWQQTESIDHLPDLLQHVTRFVEATPRDMLEFILSQVSASNRGEETETAEAVVFVETWVSLHRQELSVVRPRHFLSTLLQGIDPSWHIHVANSSVVRDMQLLCPWLTNVVRCNRGVNGIEGSLSTAVGYRAAGIPTLVLIGDLSFFYDQNALWNASIRDTNLPAPLRIVIFNNGGGGIFRRLPGLEESPYRDQYIAAQHPIRARGIADQCMVNYNSLTTFVDLKALKNNYFDSSLPVHLLEIYTKE